MSGTSLVWLRNDLRLHDNEALTRAQSQSDRIIIVYCLDPDEFLPTELGFPRMGSFRWNFLRESLLDLRSNLAQKQAQLVFRMGKAWEIIPELVKKYEIRKVYVHQEVGAYEIEAESRLESALDRLNCRLSRLWGSTLFHPEDLPFPMKTLPDQFTQFRKKTEQIVPLRPVFEVAEEIITPTDIPSDDMPAAEDLGLDPQCPDPRRAIVHTGGESAGRARLRYYLDESHHISGYKESRNGMLGADYSSKFSAWLSLGCLSPRQIVHELHSYESDHGANESTYWMFFELLWRDFFRFTARKFGKRIFFKNGINGRRLPFLKNDLSLFERWRSGTTGIPFIDANMRELLLTGFMSNRGRQNAASFLVKDLKINWQWGAMWFESQLIDYDVSSNWLNWLYIAGLGNDPRSGSRHFNIMHQARHYDPLGEYVKHWLPELRQVPRDFVHQPDQMTTAMQIRYNSQIGKVYPIPLIDGAHWV